QRHGRTGQGGAGTKHLTGDAVGTARWSAQQEARDCERYCYTIPLHGRVHQMTIPHEDHLNSPGWASCPLLCPPSVKCNRPTTAGSATALKNAAAICDRPALCTHAKITVVI